MAPRSIVIDCDPGQDDAVALLMALSRPDALEVLAVTAVGGNVPLARTEANARRVVEATGRVDVPVFAGCAKPLLEPLVTAEYVHGETGLDGSGLPEVPGMRLSLGHGVDAMIDIVASRPDRSVTLVPTGPLTNVALAFAKAPEVMGRVAEIVLMGGAVEMGNVTPAAEFNIYVDPHAAKAVFAAGVPVAMFGLDVTHKVLVTQERLARIGELDGYCAKAARNMLEFTIRFDVERYGEDGGPLHDPCTIAYLLRPELFTGKRCFVDVEAQSPLTRGMTVVDWHNQSDQPKNAAVMRGVDADGFFDLLQDCLERLP